MDQTMLFVVLTIVAIGAAAALIAAILIGRRMNYLQQQIDELTKTKKKQRVSHSTRKRK